MSMTRTILRDILVLSAQAVAYRLAAPQEQQAGVVFAAVPTRGMPAGKALPTEDAPQARKVGF